MSKATSNAHDWHCEEHDTYGWRGEACRECPTAASEITTLREQVEKLTKERDDLRSRRCEVCGYLEHEREHTGCLREQLAALAEQNEKFRKLLPYCNTGHYGYSIQQMYFEAAQLPDLASPALNRIRAEGMREAAKFVETQRNDIPACGFEFAAALRARAAELEKSND